MEAPKHLKHKPIISVSAYDNIDGKYAKNTDAKALSIGKAQWDNDDLSVKVWRHSSGKWSRQSEELPIHRVFDLSILAIAGFLTDPKSNYPVSNFKENIDDETKISFIKKYLDLNSEKLLPRIKELHELTERFIEENKK